MHQFLVEEALVERLHRHEQHLRQQAEMAARVAAAERKVADELARNRQRELMH